MRQDGSFGCLPTPRTLVKYKNKVAQDIGINNEILQWMRDEATKKSLPPNGWKGGLLFDEMAIQVNQKQRAPMSVISN